MSIKLAEVEGSNGFLTSTANQSLEIINLHLLEKEAKETMHKGAFGYIREGAEDETVLKRNLTCWETKKILPRMLANVEEPTTNTSFLGIPLTMPIISTPVAAQTLCHVEGELNTARALNKLGSIFCLSAYGSTLIEDAAKAGNGGSQFFQLYMSKNDDFNKYTLEKAREHGYKAIILTADATVGGYREDDIINKFTFPFPLANLAAFAASTEIGSDSGSSLADVFKAAKQALEPNDIAKLKEFSGGLPIILKGVQSVLDAEIAIHAGVDAIGVSNHGGRQLDGAPGSFEVLPDIAKIVNKRVPIIFDSGIRRGSHVFKAIAAGADIVALGRPFMYGMHLGGEKGIISVFEHLQKELLINMQLAGTRTIDDIKKTLLVD